jgi:hypothetical protein
MAKRHLIRTICDPLIKTACGINPDSKKITLSPQDVSCSNCLRCMTKKEIQRYLGGSNG